MKKTSKLILTASALAMLASCSIEDPVNNPDGGSIAPEGDVFMGVNIAMPFATKTATGNTGTEVGSEGENSVKEVLLVIASTDGYKYLLHGNSSAIKTGNVASQPQATVTTKIERTDIKQAFYDSGLVKNNEVDVFVFCNPTDKLKETVAGLKIGDSWTDGIYDLTENPGQSEKHPIWTDGSFLMSNASIAKRLIPSDYNDWIQKYTSEKTPFSFSGNNQGDVSNGGSERGPVKVERSVARIDFRDGSQDKPRHASAKEPYTYNIGKDEDGNDDESLRVKLVRMAFVNMSKEFYYLRRVSDNGMPDGNNFAICGEEALVAGEGESNFVVDTDAEFKSKKTLEDGDFSQLHDHFNFPLFDREGKINDQTRKQWYSTWIPDIEKNNEDNATWTPSEGQKDGYRVWRYATENTIPADNTNQRTSLSSGVVFKGKLVQSEETRAKLAKAIKGEYVPESIEGGSYILEVNDKNYPILYTYEGALYVGWNDEVKDAAKAAGEGSPLFVAHASADAAYQTLVKAQQNNSGVEEALTAFRQAATGAGFTLYQPSDDSIGAEPGKDAGVGYYFYYYYFNRHNDNGMPGTMANMEFAVVRNNVYKLAVTDIKGLGHPRITDNDPDPIDPEEPDEAKEVYFEVQVDVLPWTVRVNNIEF